MSLGWAVMTDHRVPRTQAAEVLRAGAHSTLHGVVFAILCPGPAVYRRRVSALRLGYEIVLRTKGKSIRLQPIPIQSLIRKSGYRFSLATAAVRVCAEIILKSKR